MCLMLPISTNYMTGWKKTELSLEEVQERVDRPGGCTLSEILQPSDQIKPYVDVDYELPVAQFDSENTILPALFTRSQKLEACSL